MELSIISLSTQHDRIAENCLFEYIFFRECYNRRSSVSLISGIFPERVMKFKLDSNTLYSHLWHESFNEVLTELSREKEQTVFGEQRSKHFLKCIKRRIFLHEFANI